MSVNIFIEVVVKYGYFFLFIVIMHLHVMYLGLIVNMSFRLIISSHHSHLSIMARLLHYTPRFQSLTCINLPNKNKTIDQ